MTTMVPRERFLTALRCQQPDRVPVWDWVNNPALYQAMLGQTPRFFDGGLAARLSKALGLDAVWAPAGGFMGLIDSRWDWQSETTYVDEWRTLYQVEAGSWPLSFPKEYPVKTEADWENLPRPEPVETWRLQYARDALAEARREPGREVAVVAGIRGPLSSAWMLMGLVEMSFALFDRPAMLQDIFQTLADFWTQIGLRLIELGADALVVHDDQGSNSGTFFAPEQVRQFILPYLSREINILRDTGTPVILHSCGNINSILKDLVATGIVGLNNLQRAAQMDIGAVKAAYGDKLCLIGNVDASNLMPTASPAEVEQAVIECLQLAAPGGGYILATDHSFHEGIPVNNVFAFIAAGKKYGVYQILF
jgi:uroporphyrinogen decarboxylase